MADEKNTTHCLKPLLEVASMACPLDLVSTVAWGVPQDS